MRQIGVTSQHAKIFQHLARYLVYPDMHLRAEAAVVHAGLQPQSALWPLAISGDHPIFTLRINDDIDLEIAKEALSAQEYLRSRGIIADLVIMNERAASYAQDMQHDLDALCESVRHSSQGEGLRPHIFAARKDLMEPETYQQCWRHRASSSMPATGRSSTRSPVRLRLRPRRIQVNLKCGVLPWLPRRRSQFRRRLRW